MIQKIFSTRVLPYLFFVFAALFFLGPVFAGFVFFPEDGDLAAYYYPVMSFYSDALRTQQSFLWLPHIYSGFPVYLSQSGGFFEPLNLFIFSVLDGVRGVEVRLMLDVFLVFVFSYLAARALGISRAAASLVGPSYILALNEVRFLSNPLTANALFLLPLLLWAVTRALQEPSIRWRYVCGAGIGLGFAVLSGYTQVVFYATVLAGLYTLGYVLFVQQMLWMQGLVRIVKVWSVVMLLGILIGLPQLLPALEFMSLTSRAAPATYAQITLKAIAPGDLLLSFVPDYFFVPYITPGRKPLFVGVLWMLLAWGALVAVLFPPLFRRQKWQTLSLMHKKVAVVSGVFLFAFIAALQWSPLFFALSKLPVFSLFRFPFRFMFLGAFLLSLLAAFGLDMVGDIKRSRAARFAVYTLASVGVLFVTSTTILAVWGRQLETALFTFGNAFLFGRLGLSKNIEHYHEAIKNGIDAYREFLFVGDVRVGVPYALLVCSVALIVLFFREKISETRFRTWAIILGIVTYFSLISMGWSLFKAPDAYAPPSVLATVVSPKELATTRMYAFLSVEASRKVIPPQYKLSPEESAVLEGLLIHAGEPNRHMWNKLLSVDGYDQFEPTNTLEAMGVVGGELGAGYGGATPEEKKKTLLAHLDVLGMMGGAYIVSGVQLSSPSLSLMSTPRVTEYGITLYVYKNAYARPLYYVADTVVGIPHTTFMELMRAGGNTFTRETYLDCVDCKKTYATSATLTELTNKNGLHEFRIISRTEQYLVLSQTFLPGWVADIDGKEVLLIRANGLYMAVSVPAGEHTVRFTYRGMLNELSWLTSLGLVK